MIVLTEEAYCTTAGFETVILMSKFALFSKTNLKDENKKNKNRIYLKSTKQFRH